MLVLACIFSVGSVANDAGIPIRRFRSFLHLWMAAYFLLLALLMAVTTGMTLVLLFDAKDGLRIPLFPSRIAPLAAAVFGVFGFETLVRKLIVGFGENQFDLDKTLQSILDQAVAATLEREA